jgi:hypothetical protein
VGFNVLGYKIKVHTDAPEVGIMLNIPLSRIKDGNLLLATELNWGDREVYANHDEDEYQEAYLNIPLMFQYVSFFFPASAVQVHLVPSPKRHVLMHLKTIIEAGAFIDIPLGTTFKISDPNNTYTYFKGDYKDRNFFDLGGMVGYAAQLENIILGLRLATSYVDFGGSSLLLQVKGYLGYLF